MININIKLWKKTSLTTLIISCVFSQNTQAEEFKFIPRAWAGVMDYSFKQDPRVGAMPDGSDSIRESVTGAAKDAEKLGEQLAARLLDQGAAELLEAAGATHG